MITKTIAATGTAINIIAGITYSSLTKTFSETTPKEKTREEQWWESWAASVGPREKNETEFSLQKSVQKLEENYKKEKGLVELKKDFQIKGNYRPLKNDFHWIYGGKKNFWTSGRAESFLLAWCNHPGNSENEKVKTQYQKYCV